MCKDYIILLVGSIQESEIIIDARYMHSISEYQGLGLMLTLYHRLIRLTKNILYSCTCVHVYIFALNTVVNRIQRMIQSNIR